MRYDEQDPEDIAMWQIVALVFIVVVLASIAGFAFYNIVKSVA